MTDCLWVLPSIDKARGDGCALTLAGRRVLRVPNWAPNANIGVAESWNQGRRVVLTERLDYLIVVSEAMRFGPKRGADFERALRGPWCGSEFRWHLVAIRADTLADVGPFDGLWYPGGHEDSDYLWRLRLAGYQDPDCPAGELGRIAGVDATDLGHAHSVHARLAHVDGAAADAAYVAKWGGTGGREVYRTPYDDPALHYRDVSRGV